MKEGRRKWGNPEDNWAETQLGEEIILRNKKYALNNVGERPHPLSPLSLFIFPKILTCKL